MATSNGLSNVEELADNIRTEIVNKAWSIIDGLPGAESVTRTERDHLFATMAIEAGHIATLVVLQQRGMIVSPGGAP